MNTELISIMDLSTESMKDLCRAAEIIRRGGLVVFPTETVYGLGADATNAEAAAKIFEAKGRPSDNPLIIHIAEPENAERYTYTNDTYFRLARAFMPGPLTVILPARECIPPETRASLPTVAVRCPEHPVARKLIELSGVPIAAPSANISGSPSPTKAKHVIDDMTGRVDMIIDGGDSEFGLESTIVKIDGDGSLTLLRPGKITVDDLRSVCPSVKIADAVKDKLKEGETVLSPGMKYRHYAPRAEVFLLDMDINSAAEYIRKRSKKCRVAAICYEEDLETVRDKAPGVTIYEFGKRGDELTQAHMLFDILRDADKKELDELYAPLPRAEGLGLALYNRMIRAAAYHIIRM
ncbi:MAG: threonylcarbamoyl-AMP synthase [Ruminococcaceae bacterium]|nr:threonylcarbamoyl-AMP synthase [Oscillospiraceae bacterium]